MKLVRKLTTMCGLMALTLPLCAQESEQRGQVDPNHRDVGGYGYLIEQNSACDVWWAEGLYKVMKDAPTPDTKGRVITLDSAQNEWESFIVVLSPKEDIENAEISISEFNGNSSIESTIRNVEYINISKPTDYYGKVGEWPDALPLYREGVSLKGGENRPFWINVKTPKGVKAGKYTSELTISLNGDQIEIPIKLKVRNFELPKSPSMRSGFGFNMNNVIQYNNLKTQEQKERVFDMHMKMFGDYKVSPYNPFYYATIDQNISGVEWSGGFYDSKNSREGKYAYKVVDNSLSSNSEAASRNNTKVKGGEAYHLQFWAKSEAEKQEFVVGVEFYDESGALLRYDNQFQLFEASPEWKSYTLNLGSINTNSDNVKIRLFPSKRTSTGENIGTMWFDLLNLVTLDKTTGEPDPQSNALSQGNFEVNLEDIDIKLDFDRFNRAAEKYIGEYGFNSFVLYLKGLGGGTFYQRYEGQFEGFAQGTPEYELLMERYLKQIEANLDKNDYINQMYVYWFDEPYAADYPFVHETNAMIKKYAPKLRTFITEHITDQDISDVTDISCTAWHKLDHDKVARMRERGLEYWSYVCLWPRAPWISEFIDHDVVNLRMWSWASYAHNLNGILIWESVYWNSPEAAPDGMLLNPWDDGMSWAFGYGLIKGRQDIWGNGEGRMFYPENRHVNTDHNTYDSEAIPSLRLETIRDGIDDYEYFVILEKLVKEHKDNKSAKVSKAAELLKIPTSIYEKEDKYNKDPQAILKYRTKLADAIETLVKL